MTATCTAITFDITDIASARAALTATTMAWASGNYVVSGVVGNRCYVYKIKP